MTTPNVGRTNRTYWIVSGVAVIWNLLGCVNFLRQMNASVVAGLPASQRAIIEGRPAWATAAFAIANVTGAIGGILLLLRKPAAPYLFSASLIAVVAQIVPYFGMPASTYDMSVALYFLMPLVVAVWLLWYAQRARTRGWMR
jgi:hypothetical protein